MKKLFALVLVVCMLFAAAFAEVAVGNILDAAGNVIATVESIEDRETATAAELLNKAFDLVKNGAEDVLAAAGLNTDVVITDVFAITVVEGNTVEIATDAAVVLFSADGAAWEVLTEGKIASSGVVALVSNRADAIVVEGEETLNADVAVIENTIVIEEEKNFTGSVYGKAAPAVVVTEQAVAVITTAAGETISIPVDAAGMVVTAVANREAAADLAVRENLNWAYANIQAAESANALVAEELGNVVVRDLFDVSLYGEFKAAVEAGASFTMTFADVAGEGLVVLCSHDFATWHTVAAENVVANADGSVTLTLTEGGAVAFAVAAEETVEGGVVSPN